LKDNSQSSTDAYQLLPACYRVEKMKILEVYFNFNQMI